MRKYEFIVLFSPELSDDQVRAEAKKVEEILSTHGGQGIITDFWGKREMAFTIKKHSHASYVVFYFESEQGSVIDETVALLRLNESILKFQSHRISDKIRKTRAARTADASPSEAAAA
ncbi:MAG: 30S ribosomal protein S6 [Bdellovibrionales bacterium]|nr:30S ribosomal protein S6 [Bdellovibrionales bacterium]